jgi:hypothetical protein
MQKTGTNEEINEFIEVCFYIIRFTLNTDSRKTMTQIVALLDAKDERKTTKSSKVKAKAQTEQEAALELRAAAMKGLVKRQTLADITQLEDATSREKSNQQYCSSKYVSFPSV